MEFTIIQASFVRVKYPLQVLGFLSPSETPMYFAAIYKGSLIHATKKLPVGEGEPLYLTPTPQTFMYKFLEGKIPQNYPATFLLLGLRCPPKISLKIIRDHPQLLGDNSLDRSHAKCKKGVTVWYDAKTGIQVNPGLPWE